MSDTDDDIGALGSAYGEELSKYFNNQKPIKMDIFKGKVEEVTFNREFQASHGPIYYFNIKLNIEGESMIGEFSTNKRNQTKFLVDNEYEVNRELKSNRGGTYNFFDLSAAQKEKNKSGGGSYGTGTGKSKDGWKPYVRPLSEVKSIISQSSYESAVLLCLAARKDHIKTLDPSDKEQITTHTQLKAITKQFINFIVDESGLNTEACKQGDKDALKIANDKSIVLQKAMKIAIIALDMKGLQNDIGDVKLGSTLSIASLTRLICDDINELAKL